MIKYQQKPEMKKKYYKKNEANQELCRNRNDKKYNNKYLVTLRISIEV